MNVLIVLIYCCVVGYCADEELVEDDGPKFNSTSSTFNVVENSTISIPCYLENMENTTTIWFRNGRKIADSRNSFQETPTNIRASKNHTLTVTNIQRSDSGEYSCHVVVRNRNRSSKQHHLVNVMFPSTVYPEPNTGGLDVELMQPFSLTCDVTGNPRPAIKWYFKNRELLTKNEYLSVFNVSKATKEHSGEYHCVADNSVGKPAMANFHIRILYYPEITVPRDWVHSAKGERTELVCNVSATPRAKVDWYHDHQPVNFSSKISTRIFGEKHVLTIKDMKYSDFGNYSCQATNFLGRNIKTIQVSGLANPAIFKADPRIRTETSYTLIWEVDSYSPIIQYNLRFRKQQRGDTDGHWIQLIIPTQNSFTSVIHSESYRLSGLEPATVYEAVISSKNEFGWSEPSKSFLFATVGTNVEEVPQELDFSPDTTTLSTTTIQVLDTKSDEEYQENSPFVGNASKLKVPLVIILLTSIIILH
ncbi:lachesin-like [Planococcus citri]|uniref:lachesin-like n=1 Tax=Planococcus citri TaxID=170843 RepID=UPI0031F893A4